MIKKTRANHNLSLILTETVKINNLTSNDVIYLADESSDIVNLWLTGKEKPSKFALMQLFHALYKAKLTIPRSLNKFVESQQSRAKYWGEKFKSDNAKARIEREYRPLSMYVFHGNLLTLSEIGRDCRCIVSAKTLRSRIKIKGIPIGGDVSEIAAIQPQPGKKLTEN